ncbi:ubiquitin carboxyl-terminal hydrolase 34 [Neocloeon triangulifer]|uniref:ubiquitin carboxyl-terminal hydrolase 34 n=1 Tax=Neocloeon triangulifer TaxID=2078957 RepID=UPI00286EF2F8|nr:ubiquitin carboxyl-terminal hydrolase 34 [Neocloeon triangulifer]
MCCEDCGAVLQLLESYEQQVRLNGANERPVLAPRQVEVLAAFVHAWPQRQCVCVLRAANFERFNLVLQSVICASVLQLKALKAEGMAATPPEAAPNGWNLERRLQLLGLLAKMFTPNFPLYLAYKHHGHPKVEEMCEQEASTLSSFCELADGPMGAEGAPLWLLRYVCLFCKSGGLFAAAELFEEGVRLEVGVAQAVVAVVCNVKQWLNGRSVAQLLVPLRSRVLRFLCRLPDRELRLPPAKALAELVWALSSPPSAPPQLDRDGLELAFKYFSSSTLTMRLAGLAHLNLHLNLCTELAGADAAADHCARALADWLVERDVVAHIFGPNLHVEVIKQSQLVLSFLAMEGRLTNEHVDTVWAAAQQKHCARQVHDLLPPLIKHLEARPVLHLYRLLCRLEPKEHTEQSLFLAAALIKFIWSSSSSEALLKALPTRPHSASSEENSVSMDEEEDESEDGRKTASTASDKRPPSESSAASSGRPASRHPALLRPRPSPPDSEDDEHHQHDKMVAQFMMVDDDDDERSQASSSNGGCLRGMLGAEAIVVSADAGPGVDLAGTAGSEEEDDDEEEGSYSSRMSTKSEKNMADFEGEESACEEEELSQLAASAAPDGPRLLQQLFQPPLHRLDTSAVFAAQFRAEDVCARGNTLLWDLLQDETIEQLGDGLALEAEKSLANLLCYNTDKYIRLKFIEGCLENLKRNRCVVVSLRLLPKLLQSLQTGGGRAGSAEVQQTSMWAEHEHQMMSHFFASLEALKRDGPRHPNLFPLQLELQVRLNFLTSIYATPVTPDNFRLTLDQVDILWNCLSDEGRCSDELAAWLLSQARSTGGHGPPELHALSLDALRHLYLQKLPSVRPESISMVGLSLFQQLCNLARLAQSTALRGVDAVGMQHLWKVALKAKNTDVSMAAIQYLNSFYVGRQLEQEAEFVEQCMAQLQMATAELPANLELSLTYIQRAILLLRTHLEIFRRRYAYHLRRWYLEGQGVVSHMVHVGEGSALRVVVQPAGVPDKATLELQTTDLVAELRAEVAHWYEGLQARSLLAPAAPQSTPVLGSLLADGPIRIITQGQELNTDFDEKTLHEMGFKDNQLIFISMGAARPNKKRDEAASLLPPPPRDSLPTLLLLQPRYFDQLFQLLHTLSALQPPDANMKAQVLSRRVWEILTLLPTSPTLLKGLQAIGAPTGASLESLLDPGSPQKLMYSLHIVESLSKNNPPPTKRQKLEEESGGEVWSERFIRAGGLRHLVSIFSSGVLQGAGEWQQDCLAQLLKLLCLLGVAPEGPPGTPDGRKAAKHRLVDRLVVHRLNKDTLDLLPVEETMSRLTSILLEAAEQSSGGGGGGGGLWGRAQVVHFAMALLVSWVHSAPAAKTALLASPDLRSWLHRLVLDDPEACVRREVCAALCRMCLCPEAELAAPLLSHLLHLLPAAQRIAPPPQVDPPDESKNAWDWSQEAFGASSKDYFWLLCHLLDSLTEAAHDVDLEALAATVASALESREHLDARRREDEGLVGLLNLATNILKHDPPFKTSPDGLCLLDATFDMLFALPDPANRHLPKCKSIGARNAAYELLLELCRRSVSNFARLHAKVLAQQTRSGEALETASEGMPWDYWPHEDGRADCGLVGLANLGATCYMAACVQHVYMLREARAAVLSAKPDAAAKHAAALEELQRMFAYLLESERKAYNPRSFCRVYHMHHQPLNTAEQKDMAEFFIDLVSKLEEMTPQLKRLVKRLFCGVLSNNFVSLDCEHVSRNVEEFYTVRCQVADMRNLYESLDEVTVKDTLEGDNMYTCSQCGRKVRAEKRACFKRLPKVLCFNTMRYTFNMLTMLKEKVNTHFSFPLRLDMSGYVEKHLMPQHHQDEKLKKEGDMEDENDEEEGYEYQLIGVTVHTGTADGGHYYSFIRASDKWFLFNDAEVKPFDSSQLATECFGGEMTSKTYDSVTDKFLDFSFEKTNSAYMLFYERVDGKSDATEDKSFDLSKDLEEWIWNDNRNFLRDKNIFEHTYFNFMWQMCSYVPQSLAAGAVADEQLARLTTSFFLETFVHAKEKPMLVQWVDLVSRQLSASRAAGEWFLSHMADDPRWPLELFVKCPSQMVRQTFQRLCLQIVSKLRPHHVSLYAKCTDPTTSCVTKFVNTLLNLLDPSAKIHIRHLTEYFSFLHDFCKLGEEECQFLISVNAIASFVFFLVGPLDASGEMVSVSEEEDEDELVAMPPDKYKPASLEKMITLVATLVEKSRGDDHRLHLSQVDLAAITGGKGFPFLYLQTKDSINLTATRNLIFALTRYNERLAAQVVQMVFAAVAKHSEASAEKAAGSEGAKSWQACQPFFKLLTLLTDPGGGPAGGPAGLPCFSQLIVTRIWEAAELCPQSSLEWLTVQVPRNKLAASWVLDSLDKWLEPYLLAHNNQRVRTAAANLLVALVPNANFKTVYRHPRNVLSGGRCGGSSGGGAGGEFSSMSPEATQVQHKIYGLLLGLLKPARQYIDAAVHGTTKLSAFFALLTHFATSRTEKLMFGPFFSDLWHIFHPRLSEPAISINHNKQTLLLFWHHVLTDCPENIALILNDAAVVKNIAFNYILADHDDQELLLFNRHMLPPYYGILRLCCQQSRTFTRHLANHQNIQWAFKNITPYHIHYPDAVDELFKLMQLFVAKFPDSTEQELQEIAAFRRSTITLYLQTIEGRSNWSTLVAALRILLDSDEDRLFLAHQGGIANLLEGLAAVHVMYHEATACHVGGDLVELLGVLVETLRAVRGARETGEEITPCGVREAGGEAARRLATLLNTYNPAELRTAAVDALTELLLLQPAETLHVLVPLLTHCHLAYQEAGNALPLGPYFPRRGHKVPPTFKINVRPQRPMVQMVVPHMHLSLSKGTDEDLERALVEFYEPYHRLIDTMVRVALRSSLANEPLVNLSAIIGLEGLPLQLDLFPRLWNELLADKGPTIAPNERRRLVQMLAENAFLVSYVETVLLDERLALNRQPVYDFVAAFLPKVQRQVVSDQTRALIGKLVDELVSVAATLDLRAQSGALNADLRALTLAARVDAAPPASRLTPAVQLLEERLEAANEDEEPLPVEAGSLPSEAKKSRLDNGLTNGGGAQEDAWPATLRRTLAELRAALAPCDSSAP